MSHALLEATSLGSNTLCRHVDNGSEELVFILCTYGKLISDEVTNATVEIGDALQETVPDHVHSLHHITINSAWVAELNVTYKTQTYRKTCKRRENGSDHAKEAPQSTKTIFTKRKMCNRPHWH